MENNLVIPDSESLGLLLKRARELRGISLEEVSEATRIRPNYLRAIEQNQLDQLPGLVFLKGYVKSYVNYVGLNSDEVMTVLEDFVEPREKVAQTLQKQKIKLLFLFLGVCALIFFLGWILGKYL